MSGQRLPNFIIGGTEKAGTTSVFDYLCTHPQVCGSSKKETDFFSAEYSGDPLRDAERYAAYFSRCDAEVPVLMEASPGYLGEAAKVAPRMQAMIPQVKLLFILRNPVDRFYSSFHFHRGKLNLPAGMTFESYLECCIEYDSGRKTAADLKIDDWYLKVLRFGRYAEFLSIYRETLSPARVKVMFFEALSEDPLSFMVELSDFIGIGTDPWQQYEFRKSNVTFSGKNRALHRLAMKANELGEPVLRRYPSLKRSLVDVYKAMNQKREGYDPMTPAVRARLLAYYASTLADLRTMGVGVPESWFGAEDRAVRS